MYDPQSFFYFIFLIAALPTPVAALDGRRFSTSFTEIVMRFLIEFGRHIHWWLFQKPTEAEYFEEYSVKCTLCGSIQLDPVCVECMSEAWVKQNPDFNN